MSSGCLLVGPRASRRIAALQEALRARGLPAAAVLDYSDLLDTPDVLGTTLKARRDAWVKLESPGEAPALQVALVERGRQRSGYEGESHSPEFGELTAQHFWYAGLADLFGRLPADARYLNPPADLLAMADKLSCQQRLCAAGVPVPPLLGGIESHEDLVERMRAQRCGRVFIKARYGSSGAGVLAYRHRRDGRALAVGPVEMVATRAGVRLFNSRRLRRYEKPAELAALIGALAQQQIYAEQWIPKPPLADRRDLHFDIRVVTLDACARQRVARVGRGPLTNLHLGNRRADPGALLAPESIEALEAGVTAAARVFPRSRMIGFDAIVRGNRVWILEANGFGDLLPDLRYEGRTTYEDQAALCDARSGVAAR